MFNELLQTYQKVKEQPVLFKKSHKKLKIPVNLSIFRETFNIFRTNYISHYRYLDEYAFDDFLFIYDKRTKFFDGYKLNPSWLVNLHRTNNLDFSSTNEYADFHGIKKYDAHINWTTNRRKEHLSQILHLKRPESIPFKMQEKNIVLKYDYEHPKVIYEYAFYFDDPNIFENKHNDIEYGRLKDNAQHVKEFFAHGISTSGNLCVASRDNFKIANLQKVKIIGKGYDGICSNGIDLKYYLHPAFEDAYSRWTTRYVAYRFSQQSSDGRNEYYHYLLGDFSNTFESHNLISSGNNKGSVYLDYDDIFSLDISNSDLLVSLNKEKLPKENIEDFLKLSDLFDFVLSFSVNNEIYKIDLNFEEILKGTFRHNLNKKDGLFSNFNISLKVKKSRKDNAFILINDIDDFKYFPDVSKLKDKGYLFSKIYFNRDIPKNLFPSQFLDDNLLAKYFYFSSWEKKTHFSVDNLKKLNIKREINDRDGTLTIKYKDYLDGQDKEAFISGLAFVPDRESRIEVGLLEDAKKKINSFGNLSSYFWDNVKFTPVRKGTISEKDEYIIESTHENLDVRKQWDLSGIRIFLNKQNNLSLIPKASHFFSNKPEDLFEINNFARSNGISLSDYDFQESVDEMGNIVMRAVLNKDAFKDNQVYVFKRMDNDESIKILNGESEDDSFIKNMQNLMLSAGGFLIFGSMGAVFFKLSSLFKKRKVF